MAVMVQFQLPVDFDQYRELNKHVNPDNRLPAGCSLHAVAKQEGGIVITNIWDEAEQAKTFLQKAADATGISLPPVAFMEILEILR